MKTEIFYNAATQYENMGDLIINRELLQQLRKHAVLKVNLSSVPDFYCQELGVLDDEKVYNNRSFNMMLLKSIVSQNKVYVFGKPGHICYDKVNFRHLFLTLLFYISGVKNVRVGASLGPFKYKTTKILERYKSYFYKRIGLRDRITIFYCKELGMKNVDYCPDLALALDYDAGFDTSKREKSHIIIYSFRAGPPVSDAYWNDSVKLQQITKDLATLKNQDAKLYPLIQVSFDKRFMKLLSSKIGSDTVIDCCYPTTSVVNIFSEYAKAKMVISNRLHVLLFALSRGALAIPYINSTEFSKIAGIFEILDLDFLIYDYSSVNKDTLCEHCDKCYTLFGEVNTRELFRHKQQEIQNYISSIFE